MKIRLKKRGIFGVKRIGFDARIERIEDLKKDNFPMLKAPKGLTSKIGKNLAPRGISIFIKGLEGMGVITLSPREIEMISGKREGKKKIVRKGKKRKKK